MIFKRSEVVAGLAKYTKRHTSVMAKRINETFLYETITGWHEGRAGEWLVLVPGDIWMAVPDEEFHGRYRPAEVALSGQPDRRRGEDRRGQNQ